MKNKILLASLSVTFVVAMQLTKQDRNNAEQISRQYAPQEIQSTEGGGVTTDDPRNSDSLSPTTALDYYTYQTTAGKNTSRNNFKTPGNQNSFKLPFNVSTIDLYSACDINPAHCSNDMSSFTLHLGRIVKSAPLTYAKAITPIPGFHDVGYSNDALDEFADDYNINDSRCPGKKECLDDPGACNYITYYPNNINYNNCKLPCIILFHAGGYSDCSGYNYEDALCYALARKGFIVFLVEYRRGRIKDDGTIYTSAQQMLALYRAFQDGRGAIRSIIQRQIDIAINGLPYQIDLNNIFVAGQSAGGGIANSLAYYRDQTMINAVFPVPSGELSMQTVLGDIDADYYVGPPALDFHSSIKGLWCMWGGFSFPTIPGSDNVVDEYNFLTQNGLYPELVPMIGFMGKKDPVFPISGDGQRLLYPPQTSGNTFYTIETRCLINSPFKVYNDDMEPKANLRIRCTNNIYNVFKAHGIPTLEYLDCRMGHGLANVQGSQLCSTDFGYHGNATLDEVNEYLAARACFFFQSIMNGVASNLLGATKFIDCRDFRHSDGSGNCATDAFNDSCYNSR
ncbi:MAG: alpha/beta hydrolase, partial [Chitinophagaceae bacterium]